MEFKSGKCEFKCRKCGHNQYESSSFFNDIYDNIPVEDIERLL